MPPAQTNPIVNKRPVGLYSPLLIQIIQYCNKTLHVDASKTGWTPNKKGNQRYTFNALCLTYSLTVLNKIPFSHKQEARQPNKSVAIRDSVWLQSAHNKIYHTKETILKFLVSLTILERFLEVIMHDTSSCWWWFVPNTERIHWQL